MLLRRSLLLMCLWHFYFLLCLSLACYTPFELPEPLLSSVEFCLVSIVAYVRGRHRLPCLCSVNSLFVPFNLTFFYYLYDYGIIFPTNLLYFSRTIKCTLEFFSSSNHFLHFSCLLDDFCGPIFLLMGL